MLRCTMYYTQYLLQLYMPNFFHLTSSMQPKPQKLTSYPRKPEKLVEVRPSRPQKPGETTRSCRFQRWDCDINMGVSKNKGTPKSSILIGFSIINDPFWGTSIFGNAQILIMGLVIPKYDGISKLIYPNRKY